MDLLTGIGDDVSFASLWDSISDEELMQFIQNYPISQQEIEISDPPSTVSTDNLSTTVAPAPEPTEFKPNTGSSRFASTSETDLQELEVQRHSRTTSDNTGWTIRLLKGENMSCLIQ